MKQGGAMTDVVPGIVQELVGLLTVPIPITAKMATSPRAQYSTSVTCRASGNGGGGAPIHTLYWKGPIYLFLFLLLLSSSNYLFRSTAATRYAYAMQVMHKIA